MRRRPSIEECAPPAPRHGRNISQHTITQHVVKQRRANKDAGWSLESAQRLLIRIYTLARLYYLFINVYEAGAAHTMGAVCSRRARE